MVKKEKMSVSILERRCLQLEFLLFIEEFNLLSCQQVREVKVEVNVGKSESREWAF